jgi:Tat protein translocase TatB subunit
MFDIGFQEMLLIMVLALLVFGPSRLPELGKMIGRAMREFRKASDEFRSTVETNLKINEIDPDPSTSTVAPVDLEPSEIPAAEPALTPLATAATESSVEPTAAPPSEPYWAQRGSPIFHSSTCAWASRIAEDRRMYFKKVAEGRDQGLRPCPVCEPWEPE